MLLKHPYDVLEVVRIENIVGAEQADDFHVLLEYFKHCAIEVGELPTSPSVRNVANSWVARGSNDVLCPVLLSVIHDHA
jgi:hypothetical protein